MSGHARPRARLAAVAALTALLTAALAGCGGDDAPSDPAPAAAPAAAPPTATDEAVDQVAAVGLRSSDLNGFSAIKLPPGATRVKGQVTLDQCGYDFTTEKLRTARRQVEVTSRDPAVTFSNEVVAYRDEASAAQAMAQLREALAQCDPATPVTAAGLGPGTRFDIVSLDDPFAELPVPGSLLVVQRVTTTKGSLYIASAYQQSGAILDGNYLVTARQPTQKQAVELGRQAGITGARLMALSAA